MSLKKITNNVIITILSITPLIVFKTTYDVTQLPKLLFLLVLTLSLGVLFLLHGNIRRFHFKKIEKILIIYLILVIISTIFSKNILLSIIGTPSRWEGLIAILIYIFLFCLSNRYYEFTKRHMDIFLITSSIVALYGIFQYYGFSPLDSILDITSGKRASSTIGNPNPFGTYITLILPLSSYVYINTKKIPYLIISGILYFALLTSMTRAAWIGSFIAILLLIFLVLKRKMNSKSLILLLAFFLIITIFLEIQSNGMIIRRMLSIGKDLDSLVNQAEDYYQGGSNRVYIWERVLIFIKEKPIFGYGLENLGEIFTERYAGEIMSLYNREMYVDKAHNEYLHIAVTTGIPSLLVYLSFIVMVFFNSFRNIKKNNMLIPLICSIVGYLIQAFFNFSVVSVAYIYWIFLGIIVSLSTGLESNTEYLFKA